MVQATFQQAAVYCLDRVKEIVGRNKFDHYLETFHPIIKKVIFLNFKKCIPTEYSVYIYGTYSCIIYLPTTYHMSIRI